MRVEELRIDNWVNENGIAVQLDYGRMCDDYEYAKHDDYEPITLTEEELLRFGFELDKESKKDYDKSEYRNSYNYVMNPSLYGEKSDFFRVYYYPEGRKWEKKIWHHKKDDDYNFQVYVNISYVVSVLHVHQLQNLYFALTGEELTSQ